MAFSELMKNFERARSYLRDFYVYGYKNRMDYTKKSPRCYDDEKRRMENILGEYVGVRTTAEGKTVFLSFDSRSTQTNPLFRLWKTCSFTDGDMTLHFWLMDILTDDGTRLTLSEIADRLTEYSAQFRSPREFDISTIRKKLREYEALGIIRSEKNGKTMFYRRGESVPQWDAGAVQFFSETAPCGVIGSFLLDRPCYQDAVLPFRFKHHYITQTMDSEILCLLLDAIHAECMVTLDLYSRQKELTFHSDVLPLEIDISLQNGRQYLMAYYPKQDKIFSYRLDSISGVVRGEKHADFTKYRNMLKNMHSHMWGVSAPKENAETYQVSFTICTAENEKYIPQRLLRERRIGTVTQLDETHWQFTAEVYDPLELLPWIRTFLCRISDFSSTDERFQARWEADMQQMFVIYGIGEEENHAVP